MSSDKKQDKMTDLMTRVIATVMLQLHSPDFGRVMLLHRRVISCRFASHRVTTLQTVMSEQPRSAG